MMQRWLYFSPSSEAQASASLLHQPKGFCQFWGGLILQSIHHKLLREMPARGALEKAKQLALSRHGALICERFLQSQGLGQQESVLLMPQHYVPDASVGEPPLYKTNSMERLLKASKDVQFPALCLDRHSTSYRGGVRVGEKAG